MLCDNQERMVHKQGRILVTIFCCVAVAEWLAVTFYYTRFSLSTYISLLCILVGIYFIVKLVRQQEYEPIDYRNLLLLLIAWNIMAIGRGVISASSYWDWKFLLFTNMPALLVPLSALLGSNIHSIGRLLRFIFPLFFILTFLTLLPIGVHQIAYLWTPLYFLILCLPYMTRRQKITVFILIAVVFASYFEGRSSTIRICVALVIAFAYRFVINYTRFFVALHKVLFILPIIFFILGVTGSFNIFDMQSYIDREVVVEGAAGNTENMLADTRTFLYRETLTSMDKHNSFLFGEGGCGKYESLAFKNDLFGAYRYASEVGILNTLLYSGIIGVLLYALVFYKASRLAICQSNNVLAKLIGLFVIFRWDYFFVEEFTNFNTNFFFLWLMIGMCLSPTFRNMSDEEIENLIVNGEYESENN